MLHPTVGLDVLCCKTNVTGNVQTYLSSAAVSVICCTVVIVTLAASSLRPYNKLKAGFILWSFLHLSLLQLPVNLVMWLPVSNGDVICVSTSFVWRVKEFTTCHWLCFVKSMGLFVKGRVDDSLLYCGS